jgi:hypothetical protein
MEGGAVGHNFARNLPKNHPYQVWFNSVQEFQRRRFKCESLRRTTDGRTDGDGRQTPSDGKSSPGLWPGELKSDGVKLVWLAQISPLREMKRSCNCFPCVSKMTILAYNLAYILFDRPVCFVVPIKYYKINHKQINWCTQTINLIKTVSFLMSKRYTNI